MFLLYSGLGDTYGMGFEFQDKPYENKNDLSKLYEHPIQKLLGQSFRLHSGWYTDDTEMSMAVAEALIENNVEDLTPLVFANKFVELFNTQKRHGYAQGFYHFLNSINSGQEFLDYIKPFSDRNGATMRSGPIGFLNLSDICNVAEMQAKTTHNTRSAILSSQIIALAYHYTIYDLGPKDELISFIKKYLIQIYKLRSDVHPIEYENLIFNIGEPIKGETSLKGYEASLSVLDIYMNNSYMSKALLECVERGGDTDTAGALVMGLAYLSPEYKKDIPNGLIECFKTNEPEINRLLKIDESLIKKYRKERENESRSYRF